MKIVLPHKPCSFFYLHHKTVYIQQKKGICSATLLLSFWWKHCHLRTQLPPDTIPIYSNWSPRRWSRGNPKNNSSHVLFFLFLKIHVLMNWFATYSPVKNKALRSILYLNFFIANIGIYKYFLMINSEQNVINPMHSSSITWLYNT